MLICRCKYYWKNKEYLLDLVYGYHIMQTMVQAFPRSFDTYLPGMPTTPIKNGRCGSSKLFSSMLLSSEISVVSRSGDDEGD